MSGKASIRLIYQPNASSFLGGYIHQWYVAQGHPVATVDCRASRWARLWPALLAFHPHRDTWHRRRWEAGLYSPSAWRRNTRANGRILDRLGVRGGKILQIAKEYFPHPDYRSIEYYVFINYNTRLACRDGFTPWRPRDADVAEYVALEDELFRCASHVFTAGEFLRQSLIDESGVAPDRVTTVRNGVNPRYLANPPPAIPNAFSNRLLFVGWDFGLKGGRDLLAAWPAIRAARSGVELHIVGPDAAQRDAMGAAGRQPGLIWESRPVTFEDYRRADLFVLPSLRDSYGFVFLEAMSQGLPCLGADINGMPEMIVHGESGYIVPRQSPDRIAEAVMAYYADESHRARMGAAALNRIRAHFTWDVVLGKVNAVMGV